MDYQQSLDYIYSFVDYGLKSRYKYSPETFDLTRMRTVLARLGDPQRRLPALHVAGTKGKGSVSAMSASVLRAAGYRTGLYTSPHINDFNERLQLDGQPISHDALAALTSQLRPLFDSTPGITTFEITTALAHQWFAQQQADVAVIEVGLGGRLDATNVLYPNVCAITSISYDHTQLLGKTLPEIAEEKAGIIKPGAPVVSAPQRPEALQRIETIARERGSRLRVVGRDWQFERTAFDHRRQTFSLRPAGPTGDEAGDRESGDWESGDWESGDIQIPLLGYHQIENAAVAAALMHELRLQGFTIPFDAIRRGLAGVVWPGRFEVIEELPGAGTIILDCAHNGDSIAKLAATLEELYPREKPILIFGTSDDKDVSGMLSELVPRIQAAIMTRADHPRASAPEQLSAAAQAIAARDGVALSIKVAHTVGQALSMAKQMAAPLTVIAGSIFLVADARAELKRIPIP
jgi:dihydrofolate synthase/folylpolyglutamate synthase